jgi:hypothetical protein
MTGHRRRASWLLALAVVATVSILPPVRAAANEWTFRTGVRLDAYTGAGQDGHQVLLPFALAFDTVSWGLSARGAYGNSERDPGAGLPSGEITGFTDTTASGYFRFTVGGTEIRLGLDLDLPTGVSKLGPGEVAAIQDEDLVTLQRFGEGFDVNPTVTVYRNFGAFGLGFGVGYLWKGEYDPTTAPGDDLDPGDELTAAVLVDVFATDTIRVSGRAAYTYYTADERRGQDAFQEGDEIDLLVTAEWRPEPWWATVSIRDIIRFKAERIDPAGQLLTEPRNSNGNEFRAAVTVGHILTDAWGVFGVVDFLHVAENDFPRGDPLHDGGRIKVAFGPGVTWTPDRTFGIEAVVRYFVMDVEQGPFFPQSGTVHGVHADVRLTYRF